MSAPQAMDRGRGSGVRVRISAPLETQTRKTQPRHGRQSDLPGIEGVEKPPEALLGGHSSQRAPRPSSKGSA
jgi:hypothetical protein